LPEFPHLCNEGGGCGNDCLSFLTSVTKVVAVAIMTLVCQYSRLFSPASWLDRYFDRPDLREKLTRFF
jgi:hypothetical protein